MKILRNKCIGKKTINAVKTEIAQASGQSTCTKNAFHKTCPIVIKFEEPRRSGIANSPMDNVNEKNALFTIPLLDKGTITLQNVPMGEQPRSQEASIYELSSPSK